MKRKANRRGFTLIELMIVIAIIGVLAAIAIPDFNHARLQARQKACLANMRVLEGAVDMWEMDQDAAGFGGSGVEAANADITEDNDGGLVNMYVKKIPSCKMAGVYKFDKDTHSVWCSKHNTVESPTFGDGNEAATGPGPVD